MNTFFARYYCFLILCLLSYFELDSLYPHFQRGVHQVPGIYCAVSKETSRISFVCFPLGSVEFSGSGNPTFTGVWRGEETVSKRAGRKLGLL